MHQSTFRVYVAASLDGFIADAAGGVDWLDAFQGEDFGFDAFLASVDILVMGRATYDQTRTFAAWPYPGKRVYVLTSRPLDPNAPAGVKTMGDPAVLIETLRTRGGLVWIVGGGKTIRAFLDYGAVDELEVFLMPLLLGAGRPLLPGGPGAGLTLRECEPFRSGVVRLLYTVSGPG